MSNILNITTIGDSTGRLFVNPQTIQEVIVSNYGNKFKVQVVMLSGRAYYIKNDLGGILFDTIENANLVVAELGTHITTSGINVLAFNDAFCWDGNCEGLVPNPKEVLDWD